MHDSWFGRAAPSSAIRRDLNLELIDSFLTEHKKSRKERKQGRINNTLHLWEFLLELLEDERYTPLISWTRKEEGEFKIKRQEDVAKKWGRLKQRTSMNYDKLSRALRYYYHKGIIKKVSWGDGVGGLPFIHLFQKRLLQWCMFHRPQCIMLAKVMAAFL